MYEPLEYDQASDDIKLIYDDITAHLNNEGLLDYFKILGGSNPAVLSATWNIYKAVMLHGELPRTLKELVFVAVSSQKGCDYCTNIHQALCRMLNIDDGTLQKVLTHSPDINPEKLKLAIDFALKVAMDSKSITQADHKNLNDMGLSDAEIFEIMSVASLINYSNTLSESMLIKVDTAIVDYLKVV